MTRHVVIVGAGIIGAAIAFRLSQGGARVTVVEGALPASGASGRSFGWINASFSLNEDHFLLRVAALTAHHALAADLGPLRTTEEWFGQLKSIWELRLAALDEILTSKGQDDE